MDVKRLMSQMQNQFTQAQKKLDVLEVTGTAGGENGVTVKLNGKFEIRDLKINFLPTEKEDLEILEDLIKKAWGDASAQIEAEIKKHTGGMF